MMPRQGIIMRAHRNSTLKLWEYTQKVLMSVTFWFIKGITEK